MSFSISQCYRRVIVELNEAHPRLHMNDSKRRAVSHRTVHRAISDFGILRTIGSTMAQFPSLDTSKTPFPLWKSVPLSFSCPAKDATLRILKPPLTSGASIFPGLADNLRIFLQGSHVYSWKLIPHRQPRQHAGSCFHYGNQSTDPRWQTCQETYTKAGYEQACLC